MAHTIVRTDKLTGTNDSSKLFSVKYMVGNVEADIDNGCVLQLGALEEGSREVYVGTAPAADSSLRNVVLVATPEVMYDERLKNLNQFYNVAGKPVRGYMLEAGDIFSVTKDGLDGIASPAIGNIVELQAGIKFNVVSTATGGATTVGAIIAVDEVDNDTYYVIRVA